MFEGQFLESKELTATVEEMEGVVSERSFEALFQWLYLHVVKFGIEDPVEHISASLELVRLADKYGIVELEHEMAQYIKDIIVITPSWGRPIDTNTQSLTSDHIITAAVEKKSIPDKFVSLTLTLRNQRSQLLDILSVISYINASLQRRPVFIGI